MMMMMMMMMMMRRLYCSLELSPVALENSGASRALGQLALSSSDILVDAVLYGFELTKNLARIWETPLLLILHRRAAANSTCQLSGQAWKAGPIGFAKRP